MLFRALGRPRSIPYAFVARATEEAILQHLWRGKFYICRYFGIFLIFISFIFQSTITYPYGYFNVTCYEELADAFVAGHTYLLRDPPAGLLTLPDPWDPKDNRIYRDAPNSTAKRFEGVHDLALYRGKLYLQWGPFPALVLIPLRWVLQQQDLPMGRLGLLAQTFAALAFAAATLKLAKLAGFPKSCWMQSLTLLLFLLCPIWTFVARRIAAYEFAVFFGQLCMGLALLSVVSAFDERFSPGQKKFWLLGLGSTMLGCAVNCRSDITPVGLMVPLLAYAWWRLDPARRNWRHLAGPALCLGGPAAALLACALLYNKIRFDDFFEVGLNWQLWNGNESIRLHKFHFTEVARLLPNLWYEFLCPIGISTEFPFLVVPRLVKPDSWMSPDQLAAYGNYIGWTSGLLVAMPITGLALLFPLAGPNACRSRPVLETRLIVPFLMVSGLLGAMLLLLAPITMRYEAEWCMWWLASGILMTFQVRTYLRSRQRRFGAALFDAALLVSTAWSCWVGISFLLFPPWEL
jgi:hypothetical protein